MTEKVLADYTDVFADIINVLLFNGRQLVQPEELSAAAAKSMYKADDNRLHEMERDVAKYWERGRVRIALFGLENQTVPEQFFPLRTIGYDGQNYRSQLLAKKDDNGNELPVEAYPVITLVLYFGMTRWNKPRTLLESFDIPEELRPYVNDYKINLIEVAFLPEETVQMFQSDFKVVADYFVQMQKNRDYKPSQQIIEHVDELLKIMSVLTGDSRFEEAQIQPKGGAVTMCEVLDRVEQRGLVKGRAEGRAEGMFEAVAFGGCAVSFAAKALDMSEKEFFEQMKLAGYELPAKLN